VGSIGRAFVAVVPPAPVVAALAERVATARRLEPREGLRWARQEWHATLCFLGRVDDADRLVDALARALRDRERPTVRLGGAGAFPRVRSGTALWVGFTEGAEALAALAGALGTAAASLGFEPPTRTFRPHVTVARASRARDLRGLAAALGDDAVGPSWLVAETILLESDTRRDGARYREVTRLPIPGEGR
jgi:2'-5' RNA ligase